MGFLIRTWPGVRREDPWILGGVCLPNCINVDLPEIFQLGEWVLGSKFSELVTLFYKLLYLTVLVSSFSFKNSQSCENIDFSMNRKYLSALP